MSATLFLVLTIWGNYMCWRDDIVENRHCSDCGETYYGDLGHRDCPTRSQLKPPPQGTLTADMIDQVAKRYGWDRETAKQKINRTKEICVLESPVAAVDFLLETIPKTRKVVQQLDAEDEPPF